MYRIGKVSIYIGISLIAVGMLVGFTAMFMDSDNLAKIFIGLVPIGFVLLLTGTVATQLSAPTNREQDKQEEKS